MIHEAEAKQIDFAVKIEPEVPQNLVGDVLRLNQVLTNLLGNAIKFTDKGKIWLTIEKYSESDKKVQLRFEVGDTGIGIAADQLDSIFESFNQADNESISTKEGTGLGLSIARQLVEKQGGKLFIESQLGEGTKLWFDLSFEKAAKKAAIQYEEKDHFIQKQLKILVVEDTYFNQMLVVEILKKHIQNVEIEVAENGKIALEKVKQQSFDLILMDIKMPVMDGYEATKRIRKFEKVTERNIPILAVTANALPEQLEKCKDAGMNDHITKPIDEKILLEKIAFTDSEQSQN